MKISVAQINPKTGDLKYNFDLIKNYYLKSLDLQADICIFPELITCSYSAQDLLLKKSFILKIEQEIYNLLPYITNTLLLLPTPILENGILYNGVVAIRDGKILEKIFKTHIPNYGVFDEKRYFSSGVNSKIISLNNLKIGILICEDAWFNDVALNLKNMGAQILLVANASPYEIGKFSKRIEVFKKLFDNTHLPIIYCNQVHSTDGIIFDGRSFIFDKTFKQIAPIYQEFLSLVEITPALSLTTSHIINEDMTEEDEIYGALVFGLRQYVQENGFSSVILGLSGGIDSALVAAICCDALGSNNVHTIMLPSEFSSEESFADALYTTKLLNVSYQITPILDLMKVSLQALPSLSKIAFENLQARIRGMLLMSLSNNTNNLLITTGNKSEIATGYCTLYGDMCGAFNPIKDLYKTQIYNIAKFRNNNIPKSIDCQLPFYPVIAENILFKAPSAELNFNQKDSDTLPEYSLLDEILTLFIEQDLGINEIILLGYQEDTVKYIARLIKVSEHKRFQSAPGVKISTKIFGKDRRYPITNHFE